MKAVQTTDQGQAISEQEKAPEGRSGPHWGRWALLAFFAVSLLFLALPAVWEIFGSPPRVVWLLFLGATASLGIAGLSISYQAARNEGNGRFKSAGLSVVWTIRDLLKLVFS